MDRDATKLYCPNSSCQTPNPEHSKFCQRCRTLLPKRYLWAIEIGEELESLPEILDDRYVLKQDRIYFDTQPGKLPSLPTDVPIEVRAYLRLFPLRWHIPQIYGAVGWQAYSDRTIWLLENAPIEVLSQGRWRQFSRIDLAWSRAEPLQKLGWLWQIVTLWDAFSREGVASTLLDPMQVRVEGSFVRVARLVPDHDRTPQLDLLGHLWSRWVGLTEPPFHDFFAQLCQLLIDGKLETSKQVLTLLDRAQAYLKTDYRYHWQITTLSDRGPSRSRNEDACFPPSRTLSPTTAQTLAIVCDGVGGHEGGDVASGVAIETISHRFENLEQHLNLESREAVFLETYDVIAAANDAIGKRNNQEHRQGRQRMGTTLVMGLANQNELYIAHVGDSRAYLVDRRAFYSLTVDDDVASREVRLGYAFYREAVHQPAAGSLVQALGMGSSSNLYPTLNHFFLTEDCVVLLCSDGLSDYDRVEQHWQNELLPIMQGDLNLQSAAHRLVEIANTQNGHDNVTVALMRLRIEALEPTTDLASQSAALLACLSPLPLSDRLPDDEQHPATEAPETVTVATTDRQSAPRRWQWAILTISVLLVGLLGFLLWQRLQAARSTPDTATPEALPNPALTVTPPSSTSVSGSTGQPTNLPANPTTNPPIAPPPFPLKVRDELQLQQALQVYADLNDPQSASSLAANTIVKVTAVDNTVVQLQVCRRSSTGTETGSAITPTDSTSPGNAATPAATPAAPVAAPAIVFIQGAALTSSSYTITQPEPGQASPCQE